MDVFTGKPPTEAFEAASANARKLAAEGHRVEVLDVQSAIAQEPCLGEHKDKMAGAILARDDNLLDSGGFASQLAKVLEAKYGVESRYGSAVTEIVEHGGVVSGVRTAGGCEIRADHVVLCSGSQAPKLTQPLGIFLPIYPVKGYSLTVDGSKFPDTEAPQGMMVIEPAQMYVSRLGDRIRYTSIAEFAGWDEDHVNRSCIDTVRERASLMFPKTLEAVPEEEQQEWAGGRPMTPDDLPIVCGTKYQGLWIASGGGSYGWRVACGMGQLVSNLLDGTKPKVDAHPVSLDRFGL
eukprot:TRINITY_DN55148_c0_g1_i1.p1 TRINITY_DN55148_c0_g1~~TRINITY_DN55148_c0_g1_i1.p1  ORF type:complete len:293 (+),score=68.75 TRINITY_DN55148_c0_g1_i1:257-1135(+)